MVASPVRVRAEEFGPAIQRLVQQIATVGCADARTAISQLAANARRRTGTLDKAPETVPRRLLFAEMRL
jgi:hypothetical protein